MEFILPRASLPDNKMLRRELLDQYFPHHLIPFEELIDNQWRIRSFVPDQFIYYIDPQLQKSLEGWPEKITLDSLGSYWRIYKNSMLSFNDSWSLFYWSLVIQWLTREGVSTNQITLLHIDDHLDLGSPHITFDGSGFESIFSHNPVHFSDPQTILQAVENKSIAIGSFITPFIHAMESINLLHQRYSHRGPTVQENLQPTFQQDILLATDLIRPTVTFNEKIVSNHRYTVSSDLSKLLERSKDCSILLLHIDCDAFNNRYNGDGNWNPLRASIDLNLDQVKHHIHLLFEQVSQMQVPIFMNVALSPGFFPSEYWKETCKHLFQEAENYGIIREDAFSRHLSSLYPNQVIEEKLFQAEILWRK